MSSFLLKIFACIFMLIDHIGFVLLPIMPIFRIVGRLAFPLFAFQVTVGYTHSQNKYRYIIRMLIFALVSQLPFVLFRSIAGYTSFATNIGFSLLISLLCLHIIDLAKDKKNLFILVLICPLLFICHLIKVDYSFYGPLIVIIFYIFKNFKKSFWIILPLFTLATLLYVYIYQIQIIQFWAILALFILLFYNGKKGKDIKYLFYIFYPLHMIILWIIKLFLYN